MRKFGFKPTNAQFKLDLKLGFKPTDRHIKNAADSLVFVCK